MASAPIVLDTINANDVAPVGANELGLIPGSDNSIYVIDNNGNLKRFVSEEELNSKLSFLAPQITTQPRNRYVAPGGSKPFSVAVTSPIATLPTQYRVEKSTDGGETWSVISGATTSSYTPPAAAVEDDGTLIRFVPFNDVGERASDPATLTVEQGPMVQNQYDPDLEATWAVGLLENGTNYRGVAGSANVQWAIYANKLNLNPGTYSLNKIEARVAYTTATSTTSLLFCIWKKTGSGAFEEVYKTDITSKISRAHAIHDAIADVEGEITLVASTEYYYGLAFLTSVTRAASNPGIRYRTDLWTDNTFRWFGEEGSTTLPTSLSSATESTADQYMIKLTFSTPVRVVYTITSPSTGLKTQIPRRVGGVSTIKVNNQVVATSTTQNLRYYAGATEVFNVARNHTDNTLTTGGVSQAITGQAGETFDLLTQVGDTGHNTLYVNKTTGRGPTHSSSGSVDIATISHHAKANAVRGGVYVSSTAKDYTHIHVDGSATIASIEVGWEPVVIFGDSMGDMDTRYGAYLPSAFTYPRIRWRAQIGGNRLISDRPGISTAGYKRYKHATPGSGDICEIRDYVFAFCGMALNDIQQIGEVEANIATVTADFIGRLNEVVSDVVAKSLQAVVIAPNPYHASVVSVYEAQALMNWANLMSDLCTEKKVAFFTPFWDLVDKTTINNPIPRLKSTYNADDGTHINATAAQMLCPLIAESFESNRVGGNFDPELNRFRLKLDAVIEE